MITLSTLVYLFLTASEFFLFKAETELEQTWQNKLPDQITPCLEHIVGTLYIWKFIVGKWIVSSDSTVDILYFGQSIQILNTHFHFDKFISFEPVDNKFS